jgi:hypothetical protein
MGKMSFQAMSAFRHGATSTISIIWRPAYGKQRSIHMAAHVALFLSSGQTLAAVPTTADPLM